MRVGLPRINLDGLLEALDGAIGLLHSRRRHAEVIVVNGVRGLQGDRLFQAFDGRFEAVGLHGQQAQRVPGIRAAWVAAKDFVIRLFGFHNVVGH